MGLTDIPVLLSSQGARCVLIRDHTVYSVFPSSTLTYTIQKLLASAFIDFKYVYRHSKLPYTQLIHTACS